MKPTIGRRMYFFARSAELLHANLMTTNNFQLPFDAGVVYVGSGGDRDYVNVVVTDHVGYQRAFHQIPVVTDGEVHGHPYWVEWMPYQKEQAAKAAPPLDALPSSVAEEAEAYIGLVGYAIETNPDYFNDGEDPLTALRKILKDHGEQQ